MIDQIIALKKKYDIVEEDATYAKQREWYEYLISVGLLEVVKDGDKVIGFAECVRLKDMPRRLADLPKEPEEGGILFICNLIASAPGVMFKLKDKVLRKHKDRIATMWHLKKNNQMVCIKRRKA